MSDTLFPYRRDAFPRVENYVSGPVDPDRHVFKAVHFNSIAGSIEVLERYLVLSESASAISGIRKVSYVYSMSAQLRQVFNASAGIATPRSTAEAIETNVWPFEFVLTHSSSEDYSGMEANTPDAAKGRVLFKCSSEDELNSLIGGIKMLKNNPVTATLDFGSRFPSRAAYVCAYSSVDEDTAVVRGLIHFPQPGKAWIHASSDILTVSFMGVV
jgi:hypothetical protein